jgi:hypothetical protein
MAAGRSESFLHRELLDMLRSAHEDRTAPDVLASNLERALSAAVPDEAARGVVDVVGTAVRRWLEKGEHRDATDVLLEFGDDRRRTGRLDSRQLMMLAKVLQSVGLFEASEPFYAASLEVAAQRRTIRRPDRARAVARARLAIFRHDLEGLAKAVSVLERPRASGLKGVPELIALSRISRDEDVEADESDWFSALVRRTPVMLCGPGPLGDGLPVRHRILAARILSDPLPDFDDGTDPAGGRTDLAYGAGSVGRQLLRPEDPFRAAVFGRFEALSFPSSDVVAALGEAGERTVRAYRKPRLFGHGTSFMAVNILWDLLNHGAQEILVTGITAFLGTEPYRRSQNRATAFGSVPGVEFNRCFEYSKNDVVFNRCVLRTLGHSSRVVGDSAFVRMTGLSHREYLRELDQIYGVHRR